MLVRKPLTPPAPGRHAGFTLTELLVTVGIVAILAAIAYPSYRHQIAQTRRAEMQSQLMILVQYFERRYAALGCYNAGADDDCTTDDDADLPPFQTDYDYYTVSVVKDSLGVDTYRLHAEPIGTQEGDGALEVDNAQRRFWDENDNGLWDDGEDNWHRG